MKCRERKGEQSLIRSVAVVMGIEGDVILASSLPGVVRLEVNHNQYKLKKKESPS